MARRKWTPERILLEIRRLHARGERLTARRLRAIGLGGMVVTAYRIFGSWQAALAQAGVDSAPYRPRRWTVERIVEEIDRRASRGQDLSYAAVKREQPRLLQAAYRHPELGNWTRALEAAGRDPRTVGRRRCWSRQRIVEQIQALAAGGANLSVSSIRKRDPRLFGAACDRRYFGSWAAALAAAGVDYGQHRVYRRWTPERIAATVKHLYATGQPLTPSWLRRNGYAGLVAAARRSRMFGSWREAVEHVGVDYEQACARAPMSTNGPMRPHDVQPDDGTHSPPDQAPLRSARG